MTNAPTTVLSMESDEERQTKITTALTPLQKYLGTLTRFTVASVLRINLTVDDFCRAMGPLVSYASLGIFERLVAAAYTMKETTHIMVPTTSDLYRLSIWIETPAGKKAISEIAWIRIFEVEHSEYVRKRKRTAQRYKREMAELDRELAMLHAKNEESIARLESRYKAVIQFQEIDHREEVNRSWEMYVQDCNAKNMPVADRSMPSLIQALEKYGPKVRCQHIEQYCQKKDVKAELEAFRLQEICRFEDTNVEEDPFSKKVKFSFTDSSDY